MLIEHRLEVSVQASWCFLDNMKIMDERICNISGLNIYELVLCEGVLEVNMYRILKTR